MAETRVSSTGSWDSLVNTVESDYVLFFAGVNSIKWFNHQKSTAQVLIDPSRCWFKSWQGRPAFASFVLSHVLLSKLLEPGYIGDYIGDYKRGY